jgi:maltose O-acetyltransferase
MKELLRQLYWDFSSESIRYTYLAYILRDIPGGVGIYLRRQFYKKRFKRAGKNLIVLTGTFILNPQNIECGDNVHIGINNYIQAGGGLTIGSDAMLGPFVKIWTQNHNYKDYDMPVHSQGYFYKPVSIGADVWIGANVFIMPGVHLGDKCIISASSVVLNKVYKEGTILAGYPARKIGERRTTTLQE